MKRAPLVITGTACGLLAVIGYHTAVPQALASAGSAPSASAGNSLSIGGSSTATTSTTKAAATTTATGATRSATGSDAQYQYGDIQLKVTMTAGRITDVAVVKADVYDQYSQQLDQYALPQLRSQALRAQSAKLDGISGASYTSAAYEQSLQSALDKLKA